MTQENFFSESTAQSKKKSEIVAKYFYAWAKVILAATGGRRIAYVDIFSGPGRYDDGTRSTPLLILERAIRHPVMKEKLVTIFNDKDSENTQTLQNAILSLNGISTLGHEPIIWNQEVGEKIVAKFESMKMDPTLFFIDPWGYKGLSLRLINSVLRNWGSDCIFFFNFLRINAGLNNPVLFNHMASLFGDQRVNKINRLSTTVAPPEREKFILDELKGALAEMGGVFFRPFRFLNDPGTRTSHHLIFVSKNVLGYNIMKEIMAKESSYYYQGVATFEFNPKFSEQEDLGVFRPLDILEDELLKMFSGRRLSVKEIFQTHNNDTDYILANYRDALVNLEAKGRITVDPPAEKRTKKKDGVVTLGDKVLIKFDNRD